MAEKEKLRDRFVKSFFYDENREYLSRTALMNFIFFCLAALTIITSLILLIIVVINEWDVPAVTFITAFYGFLGTMVGGGFLQYSFTKKLNTTKSSNGKTDQSVENA